LTCVKDNLLMIDNLMINTLNLFILKLGFSLRNILVNQTAISLDKRDHYFYTD